MPRLYRLILLASFLIGSIGGGEVMAILVLALLLFGPRKIPDIGRTLGKTMA